MKKSWKSEAAIVFQESFVRELFKENNLQIDEPIHYGSWCLGKEYLSSQDIVIVVKNPG